MRGQRMEAQSPHIGSEEEERTGGNPNPPLLYGQLKKEGRRNEYEMHKLLALNQRQKMVLQRKTEEASMATRRLKELLEAKKASARETSGNANGAGIQALMQAIEHELEVTVRVHEVRSQYERQMQERASMSKEIARLKEESEMLRQKITSDYSRTMSPSARSSRMSALENMLASSSSMLVSMASQLSEAEERERLFSGRGRWNQVRSLAEAKNIMNFLFNLASSSRCQLRDKEVICKEKDSIISELKEKVVRLNGMVRQLETEVKELQGQNIQVLSAKNSGREYSGNSATNIISSEDGQSYASHKAPRAPQILSQGKNDINYLDDMETSDSGQSDDSETEMEDGSDSDWKESNKKIAKRRNKTVHHPEGMKPEVCDEEKPTMKQDVAGQCCSCGRSSSCKTKKCECRAAGSTCGNLCACVSSKCANREGEFIRKEADQPPSDLEQCPSDQADDEKKMEMISHGAMLLESALSQMRQKEDQDTRSRKPLSDIGNTVVKNELKTRQRKNWRKSRLQLVPVEPLPSSISENNCNEAARTTTRAEIPLRLPRAMSSTAIDNNPPLVDRNSVKPEESTMSSNKENGGGGGAVSARSPVRLRKNSDEKENHLR